MPLHDWTRVPAGLFHHFHQSWTIRIAEALNAGILPGGAIALVEQRSDRREGDVVAVETPVLPNGLEFDLSRGGIATEEPSATRIVRRTDRAFYADRANRIVIRHHLGRVIAVIEIVSPGNKDSRNALSSFVEKTADFLSEGIHVLVVDLFPPTRRDPQGIHKAIWDELEEEPFDLPPEKNRVLVSYEAGYEMVAYVETIGVGDVLPSMPLYLTGQRKPNLHVAVPLEETYQATWAVTPAIMRSAVETGILPNPDAG